jgi:hypothetical protein
MSVVDQRIVHGERHYVCVEGCWISWSLNCGVPRLEYLAKGGGEEECIPCLQAMRTIVSSKDALICL